jgi:hypothetical protein
MIPIYSLLLAFTFIQHNIIILHIILQLYYSWDIGHNIVHPYYAIITHLGECVRVQYMQSNVKSLFIAILYIFIGLYRLMHNIAYSILQS